MYELRFQHQYLYSLNQFGVSLPVYVRSGSLKTHVMAKLDMGADVCLFERRVAIMLDIEVEKGDPRWLETLTGSFLAYGHEVTLTVLEMSFVLTIYFAANDAINRNLLGRSWVRLTRMGVVDYDGKLFLSAYDDEL